MFLRMCVCVFYTLLEVQAGEAKGKVIIVRVRSRLRDAVTSYSTHSLTHSM
jgi:hypothetical protein